MKVKTRKVEIEEFGLPGLECEGEWLEAIPRAALLAGVDDEFTKYQREIRRLQRKLVSLSPGEEAEAESLNEQLEKVSDAFVKFVFQTQIKMWNFKDAEDQLLPLPKDGDEWREALPTGVQMKILEYLSDLMWGDEPVKPHGREEEVEEEQVTKKGRKPGRKRKR